MARQKGKRIKLRTPPNTEVRPVARRQKPREGRNPCAGLLVGSIVSMALAVASVVVHAHNGALRKPYQAVEDQLPDQTGTWLGTAAGWTALEQIVLVLLGVGLGILIDTIWVARWKPRGLTLVSASGAVLATVVAGIGPILPRLVWLIVPGWLIALLIVLAWRQSPLRAQSRATDDSVGTRTLSAAPIAGEIGPVGDPMPAGAGRCRRATPASRGRRASRVRQDGSPCES